MKDVDWLQKMSKWALLIPSAERAHDIALRVAEQGRMGPDSVTEWERRDVLGIVFPNPVGLAAGFDKSGVAVSHWHKIGVGFAEIGTVTPLPQPGNPRPRLFRVKQKFALINRMGFNNDGADSVRSRLISAKPRIPIGINIGKNKATPAERAVDDYVACFSKLAEFADYVCVNVSSPNTPDLRDLQRAEEIGRIVGELRRMDAKKPIFVKFSPDEEEADLLAGVEAVLQHPSTGVTLTNTTVSRKGVEGLPNSGEQGGLSGEPLRERAMACLEIVRRSMGSGFPIIASGGVMGAQDVRDRLNAGADLVQAYTGMVYGGANFFHDLAPENGLAAK